MSTGLLLLTSRSAICASEVCIGCRGCQVCCNVLLGTWGANWIPDVPAEWDEMRSAAKERWQRGEMPSWFDPHWLTMAESPVNRIERMRGNPMFQDDDRWLGRTFSEPELDQGGDGGDNSSGGKGRGGGWWREDDPYWMMRDWGDHPMRWWTLVFAAVMAGEQGMLDDA